MSLCWEPGSAIMLFIFFYRLLCFSAPKIISRLYGRKKMKLLIILFFTQHKTNLKTTRPVKTNLKLIKEPVLKPRADRMTLFTP